MTQQHSNLLLDEPSKRFVNVNTSACFVSLVQFYHLPVVSCISETQIKSSMLFFPIFLILLKFLNLSPRYFFKMLVQVFYCYGSFKNTFITLYGLKFKQIPWCQRFSWFTLLTMGLVYTWENNWHRLLPIMYSGMSFRLQDSPTSGSWAGSSQGDYFFYSLPLPQLIRLLSLHRQQPVTDALGTAKCQKLLQQSFGQEVEREVSDLASSTQKTGFFPFQLFQNDSPNWTFTEIPGQLVHPGNYLKYLQINKLFCSSYDD